MITIEHGDERRVTGTAATDAGTACFTVEITGGRRAATLSVSCAGGASADDLVRGALDALLTGGVVHGLDRAHVSEAVAARDGLARAVARATLPTAPVDGTLELLFDDEARRDPLHTVPAGTLLARCTPARLGEDGVAVTGLPLPAAIPETPHVRAGAGTEESLVGWGVTVVRALIDGRPRLDGERIHVDPRLHVATLRPCAEPISVHGSLSLGGRVADGLRIGVSGDLEVAGDVARAHIESGGDIRIAGSCLHSEIHAGALGSAHRLLLRLLGDGATDLASASVMAAQMVTTVGAAGRQLNPCEALRVVLAGRHPHLEPALAAAAGALREPGVAVEERVHDAITGAAALITAVVRREHVAPERIAVAGQALTRSVVLMRATAGHTSGVEASYLQACRVDARGSLVLTGAGTYNVEARVGGDVRALGPGATLRGGVMHVGGRLSTTELGAPGGAPVRVVLEGRGGGRRLEAAVAHPGVEVVCGGRPLAIVATTLNLWVGFDEENRVDGSEGLLG